MFDAISAQPTDKIMELMSAFRNDPRDAKIDLGVGVYRNAEGITPVMRAVRAAERHLVETQTTKVYTAPAGEAAFGDAIARLVLGQGADTSRVACVATPGGTGAIRQGFDLTRLAAPQARVWVSDPSWPNHIGILSYLGMNKTEYRYFDPATCAVDFGAMMTDLEGVQAGDVVVVHGCCHNPTGADLNALQWQDLAAHLARKGAVPFIDIAYQGFGDGLEADAAGVRHMAQTVPDLLIAVSCSKNFGIYRERTGALVAVCETPRTRQTTQSAMAYLNRQNYSFPPDHGARVVTTIMGDAALCADWQTELEEMRSSIQDMRRKLADALRAHTGSDRFGFIAAHRGMFSRLGIDRQGIDSLRENDAIYMISDSRVNLAGLNSETLPIVARAIANIAAAA